MAEAPIERKSRSLWTRSYTAAETGKADDIKSALSGTSPEEIPGMLHYCSPVSSQRITPLAIAAFKGHMEVVRLLVHDYKEDVNQIFRVGMSMNKFRNALLYAALGGYCHIVEFLMANGCDSNSFNTMVSCACARGKLDTLSLKHLFENGAFSLLPGNVSGGPWQGKYDETVQHIRGLPID